MPPSCSSGLRGALRRLFAWGACAALASGCAHLDPREERSLGEQLHAELAHQLPLLRDPVVVGYVAQVGAAIARAAPSEASPQVHILVDPSWNAFAAPGGHVYVHTGTLLAVRDVSELAAVLAHELGHVVHRHVAENYERRTNVGRVQQAGMLAAGLVAGPSAALGVSALGGVASLAVLNSFTRDDEREADAFAVEILPRAGYDPGGLVRFFGALARTDGGPAPAALLRSHPDMGERMREAERRLAESPPPPGLRTSDGGRLEIIQRRVRLLLGDVPPGGLGGAPASVPAREPHAPVPRPDPREQESP